MPARKILVLFAHPALERSRINRRLIDAIRPMPAVTVHDLYEAYPAHAIDVRREQALLTEHEVVVFQHPFYWYSTPAILKDWQDLVLEHRWAYGVNGTALQGKITFNAITTGGPETAYQSGGHNTFTMRQFLAPYEQTAKLCKMRYLAPYVIHSALRLESEGDFAPHAEAYRSLLAALSEDRLDLEAAARLERLAPPFSALLKPAVELLR